MNDQQVSRSEWRQRAVRLHQAGKVEEAQRDYAAYLSRFPNDHGIWSNLGALLRRAGRHELSLRAHERANAAGVTDKGIRNNYANILSDLGQYDDSLAIRRSLLAEFPDDADQKAMIGRCYRGKGDYEAAIDWLTMAVADHPDHAELRIQLAFAQLGAGDYANAFEAYRSRWQGDELTPRNLPWPEWRGEDVDGKTVLVLTEQGFGDAVLFTRFLPWLKARGARVLYLSERPMLRLFDGLDGADWVGKSMPEQERVDYWVNMMDLPILGLTSEAEIPAPTGLNVPADSTDRARAIVAPFQARFRVGVVWTGSATYKGNAFRSFSHRDFHPLIDIPDVQLFSLYKGPYLDAFHSDGTSALIVDTASTDRDFADCAATMQQMDLVITSDTATAHIAGSLGVPTWVVLHWDAFWVYRHSGGTTPWYPSMRLYRQDAPLDWDSALSKVETDLRALVSARKAK